MNACADKRQGNKSQSVANFVFQKQRHREPAFQVVDNRPEAVSQRNLQRVANNSPRAVQLKVLQGMTNDTVISGAKISQLKTTNGTAMSGVVVPNGSQAGRVRQVLSLIDHVGSLMRSARTLYTVGDVRLDMQGITTAGYYNLQVQIGGGTVSTVLMHPEVTNDQLAEVVQAFRDSQTTGVTKIVDPDQKEKVEKSKGYYDDYESLGRFDKDMIGRSMAQGVYPPK